MIKRRVVPVTPPAGCSDSCGLGNRTDFPSEAGHELDNLSKKLIGMLGSEFVTPRVVCRDGHGRNFDSLLHL